MVVRRKRLVILIMKMIMMSDLHISLVRGRKMKLKLKQMVIIQRSSKTSLVVMMKMRMLTKFILNIMKVVELVNKSWN